MEGTEKSSIVSDILKGDRVERRRDRRSNGTRERSHSSVDRADDLPTTFEERDLI